MSLIKSMRDIFPEAIPMPGAIIYNAIPAKILREPESILAREVVNRIESGNLVDLGSGTGYLAIEIAKLAPRLKVYGIDLSKAMVKIARRHARTTKNVQFEHCNVAELPFMDNSMDFIVSTGSLHHWRKPVKVLNECYRVLKNGKEAWIYDGCPDIPEDETSKIVERYGFLRSKILRGLTMLHGFRRQEYETKIKNILEQTKFKDNYKMEQTDMWMKIVVSKYSQN
ncbi:2-methoxy-6-polyprenyl-1,4-benzoquinol methylase [subsurface metagenome]